MSDQSQHDNDDALPEDEGQVLPSVDELTSLKQRADLMGMKYHPSISADKLRAKIAEYIQSDAKTPPDADPELYPAVTQPAPSGSVSVPALVVPAGLKAKVNEEDGSVTYVIAETENQKRNRIRRESLEMVRVRVVCMNPAKKEWQGEIFTVGNNAVGTVKKYIPFNSDEGWHIPRIMLTMLEQRQCQIFVTSKTKLGVSVRQGKLIKEFAIEILPALTEQELRELARRQAVAAGQD